MMNAARQAFSGSTCKLLLRSCAAKDTMSYGSPCRTASLRNKLFPLLTMQHFILRCLKQHQQKQQTGPKKTVKLLERVIKYFYAQITRRYTTSQTRSNKTTCHSMIYIICYFCFCSCYVFILLLLSCGPFITTLIRSLFSTPLNTMLNKIKYLQNLKNEIKSPGGFTLWYSRRMNGMQN